MTVKINRSQIAEMSLWLKTFFENKSYTWAAPDLLNFKECMQKYLAADTDISTKNTDDLFIYFTDQNGNSIDKLEEAFTFEWGYFERSTETDYICYYEFVNAIKLMCGVNPNDKFITDSDFVAEINEKEIPLSIAKEMYSSGNEKLKSYALSLYNEIYLKESVYSLYNTVETASNWIGGDYNKYEPYVWMKNLVMKLNGRNFDYVNSDLYLPVINVIKEGDYNKLLYGDIVARFSYHTHKYVICSGSKNEFIPINGIFNYDKEYKIGSASIHAATLACSNKLNAMFLSKYFAKEIFETCMCNSPIYNDIKWLL